MFDKCVIARKRWWSICTIIILAPENCSELKASPVYIVRGKSSKHHLYWVRKRLSIFFLNRNF